METKEDNNSCDSCDEEMGCSDDTGNPHSGQETGPTQETGQNSGQEVGQSQETGQAQETGAAQEANSNPQSEGMQEQSPAQEGNSEPKTAGEGNMGFQPGPVPGQMPFPYGYFQSPNLQPGYYMPQGGFPQGQMPGYWMPPGYGVISPSMYMQPGPVQGGFNPGTGNPGSPQPQGQPGGIAQSTNPGTSGMQNTAGGAGVQDNSGQFQQHDAPGDTGGHDNAGGGDNESRHGAVSGHHKEPNHDELKYGTDMEKPDHVGPGHPPEMTDDVSAPSGLTSFFQIDNDSFWKGILVGSLATLLLTNSTVKKGIMKTIIKASASVKGGVEELKEQLADVEAEVLHDLNKK